MVRHAAVEKNIITHKLNRRVTRFTVLSRGRGNGTIPPQIKRRKTETARIVGYSARKHD